MCVTTRRRSFREPSCSSARWMASSDSSEFMPQSSRSASSPSGKRKTLTSPSSNGIGRRSSKTLFATSVSASSVATPALSSRRLTWVLASCRFRQDGTISDTQMTPDQIVEAMPNFLIPEKAGSTNATIQFDLSGDGGGKWWVHIHDGKAESGKGDPGTPPNLTLLADAGDWVKIMTGKLDGTAAFMQ